MRRIEESSNHSSLVNSLLQLRGSEHENHCELSPTQDCHQDFQEYSGWSGHFSRVETIKEDLDDVTFCFKCPKSFKMFTDFFNQQHFLPMHSPCLTLQWAPVISQIPSPCQLNLTRNTSAIMNTQARYWDLPLLCTELNVLFTFFRSRINGSLTEMLIYNLFMHRSMDRWMNLYADFNWYFQGALCGNKMSVRLWEWLRLLGLGNVECMDMFIMRSGLVYHSLTKCWVQCRH